MLVGVKNDKRIVMQNKIIVAIIRKQQKVLNRWIILANWQQLIKQEDRIIRQLRRIINPNRI